MVPRVHTCCVVPVSLLEPRILDLQSKGFWVFRFSVKLRMGKVNAVVDVRDREY